MSVDAELGQLAADLAWVRRLARSLVKDDAVADDVAQDAYLVAAQKAPTDRPLRPWLGRVVLNLVRMRGRSAKRRAARELATGEAESAVPSPEALVARVEAQQVVAAEVLALAEPYRTVLLHYVEELPSAEIARRLGIPDATVRRRLKHALDELRARLTAREDNPRRGWLVALAPFARDPASPLASAGTAGGLVMKKLLVAVVVLVLVIVAGWWWHLGHRAVEAPPAEVAVAAPARATQTPAGRASAPWRPPAWAAQHGVPGRRVAGHVVFQGRPVAGATVRLAAVIGDVAALTGPIVERPALTPVAELTTTADGSFDLGLEPAATFVISAEADGRSPASVAIALADPQLAPPPDQLVLTLGGCGTKLSGAVVDASGGGIAHARVRVAGLGGVEADAAGRYTVCVPPATAAFNGTPVRAEAEGYGTVEIVVPGLYGDLHYDFELVPEAILVGVVVDEADHPIADAIVSAHPLVSEGVYGAAGNSAATDREGRFQIARLAPGKFRVAARADGLATDAPILAVANAASSSRTLRLVVTRRARIRGRVVMDGAPVAGARVGIGKTTIGGESMISAYSQADGSFVLDGVERGPTTLVAPPYEVVAPRTVTVVGFELTVTLEVTRRAELHGLVTRHAQPVPGAGVRCSLVSGGETRADAAGRYALVGVPSGSCQLYGYDASAFTYKEVSVKTGEDQRIDLELDGGGEVRGTVVDAHGTPVPGVFVELVSADRQDQCGSMTDDRGGFDCASLTGHHDYHPSVYPTASRGARYRPAVGDDFDPIPVKDGNDSVAGIVLAINFERLAIAGTVVDDTGAAVPDAHVEAAGATGGWGVPTARAGADGTFTVENLAAGSYTLKAHTADGGEGTVTGIAAGATGVTIAIVRPGAIEGQLIGFAGLAPHVLAESPAAQLAVVHEAIVDGDRFTFTGLPPGHYTVDAVVAGAQLDGQPTTVTSGATAQVTLRARPRATIHARVVEASSGAPVAGMQCRASASIDGREGPVIGAVVQVASDAQGQFAIDAPTGRARITCEPAETDPQLHTEAGGDFDVVAGQPSSIEVVTARWHVPPSVPGFRFETVTLPPTVARVDPNGPAAAKGIAVGDHVLSVDGRAVANVLTATVYALIIGHAPGTPALLEVEHAGTTRKVSLVLAPPH